jgi:hypothetical protein
LFRCKDFEEISSKSLHFEKKQSLLFLDKRIETMSEFVKSVGFDEWQGLRPANKPHRGLFSRHYYNAYGTNPKPLKRKAFRGARICSGARFLRFFLPKPCTSGKAWYAFPDKRIASMAEFVKILRFWRMAGLCPANKPR